MHLRGGSQRGGRQQQRRDPSELRGLGCSQAAWMHRKKKAAASMAWRTSLGLSSLSVLPTVAGIRERPRHGGSQLGGRRPSFYPSTLYDL